MKYCHGLQSLRRNMYCSFKNKKMKNDDLETPMYIINALAPFDLDPCSGDYTVFAKTNWWIGRGEDGLKKEWFGFVWCNPPFSEKKVWIDKMISHGNGILLLPERGSAPWFGEVAKEANKYFVMGKKINFIGGSSSNNIGSVLFLFGDLAVKRIYNSGLCGHLVTVNFFIPRYGFKK